MQKDWNRILKPSTWDNIIGQDHLVSTFQYMRSSGTFPKCSLFAGPSGVGKSCTAEVVAKSLVCLADAENTPCCSCKECEEVESGVSTRVIRYDIPKLAAGKEGISEVLSNMFSTDSVGTKVYILEEVHALDKRTQQPLFLEDLTRIPDNVYIIMCTTKPYSLIPEFRNRVSLYTFETPSTDDCAELIEHVAERFNLKLPEARLLQSFIKLNKNTPRSIVQCLENFAAEGGFSEDIINKYFRIQSVTYYENVFSQLIDPDVPLYDFVRCIRADESISCSVICSGLKDFVMSVLLEVSLRSKQGLSVEGRRRIQGLLQNNPRKLERTISFLGGIRNDDMEIDTQCFFLLCQLKLLLSDKDIHTITRDNTAEAAGSRMTSMMRGQELERESSLRAKVEQNPTQRVGIVSNVKDIKNILGTAPVVK